MAAKTPRAPSTGITGVSFDSERDDRFALFKVKVYHKGKQYPGEFATPRYCHRS